MEFTAPLFDDMKQYLSKYFDRETLEAKLDPETFDEVFQNLK
jgi:23S rRNA pseudouridine1911/1915/1917 synthase